jgi:diketogulonate reductase-like aldo/keto reductase
LKTDYLDLYLLHAPSYDVPIEETMKAIDELIEEGLIKNIGVSNFTVKQLKRAQKATKNKIVVNQNHYNLIVRESEKEVLQYCQENDIIFMAWRPLEKGNVLKQGKAILEEMGKKYQKTPAQIALNWLISQKNVVTISKMRNLKHLKDNIKASNWKMNQEDIEYLRENFPGKLNVSPTVPLKEWK